MVRLVFFALVLFAAVPLHAEPVRHPLDALTAQEYWSVFEAMKASGKLTSASRYGGIHLREPPKATVLRWRPGQPFRREALAIVKQGRKTFEGVVDVAGRKLISWREIKGVQPILLAEESEGVEDLVKADPRWQAAMRKRGITDFDTVSCSADKTPGYFATPEEQGRRLQRVCCSQTRGFSSGTGHPIEGLFAVWDSEERKIIRLIDTGAVPVPAGSAEYHAGAVRPREVPGRISMDQQVRGFRLDGNQVSWQNWDFHFRIDPKMGVVVTNVTYNDSGKRRSILYEGALAEIFVPYQDPAEGWYHKTSFDIGEGVVSGSVASVLEPGADCPDNAVYFDSVVPDARGVPHRWPRTACLFEREPGDPAWRHAKEGLFVESRRRRDLVLRMITTIGDYDYAVDWIFFQSGNIKIAVGATGIVEVKAVRSRTAAEDRDGKDGRYGHFVADNTVAVNHDHFFSFRLDLDIDGPENSLLKDQLKIERLPATHPRRSVWVTEKQIAKVEGDGRLHMMMERPALWRVINPNVKGPLGYPPSYEISSGHNGMSLMLDDDWPRRRAGFIAHHLWVTPFREDERYPAGDYPTQSRGGDGLPTWTKGDRRIENTDIVAWYTLGFHHVTRPEDWPIMPTVWHEFELRPFDFFARNPAVDLPRVR